MLNRTSSASSHFVRSSLIFLKQQKNYTDEDKAISYKIKLFP